MVMSESNELQEIDVKAAFHGQRKAVNMQKNSVGIVNVVSSDQVGKFPDANIGDALKRVQGINVQYDQGEARFGQVRGTSADLTSVTVNGNRMPSAEGDTRNVQLDLIPADMVQTIEVNKVVTSDMDGDAIGEPSISSLAKHPISAFLTPRPERAITGSATSRNSLSASLGATASSLTILVSWLPHLSNSPRWVGQH